MVKQKQIDTVQNNQEYNSKSASGTGTQQKKCKYDNICKVHNTIEW